MHNIVFFTNKNLLNDLNRQGGFFPGRRSSQIVCTKQIKFKIRYIHSFQLKLKVSSYNMMYVIENIAAKYI